MSVKRKPRGSIIVRGLVICVSVYMIVTLAGLWNTLNESRSRYAELQKQYAEKQAEIDELQFLLEEGSQTALIEKAARERLGYEYSDAVVYIDESGN